MDANPPAAPPYPMAGGQANMMPPYPNDVRYDPAGGYNVPTAPPLVGGPQFTTSAPPPLYPSFQDGGPSRTARDQFVPPPLYPNANIQAYNERSGAPGSSVLPTSRVELTVSAKDLLDMDVLSKSDPVCILYQKDSKTNNNSKLLKSQDDYYEEIGRTEMILNNLNPSWNKKFTLDYRFEERQVLKFVLYDWDSDSNSLDAHDFLGSIECSLGEIVAAPNNKFERNLVLPPGHPNKSSQIIIHAQELGSNKEVLYMKLTAKKLDKKGFFGRSNPYVLISKKLNDGSYIDVHQTDLIKNTLNPNWSEFSIRMVSLTSGQPERSLRFQVLDWSSSGESDLMGEFETTYCEIESRVSGGNAIFSLINPKKRGKKKNYSDSGTLIIEGIRIEEEKTFLDYIQNGVQLHFTVAIDFTASNGDPSHPDSLHYRNLQTDNQYSTAIKSVGEIIQDYDSDKLFPALGFGGRVPPSGNVSHEFFLNGNPQNPFCEGVGGILQAYYRSLNSVQLFGPTYFAPVINHVARFAASSQDDKNYFVLLIITDGVISDIDATKEAIINASELPMSIIIIGVGSEDFSAMEFLDSDDCLLKHNGRSAARDIVQFVEMQKFLTTSLYGSGYVYSKLNLTREVLAELPDQVVWWMRRKTVKSMGRQP